MKWSFPLLVGFALFAARGSAAEPVDYVRDVKPILAKNCYACHGADKQKAELRLDTAAAARKGGISGPAVLPGKGSESRLFKAITGAKDVEAMPPRDRPRLGERDI